MKSSKMLSLLAAAALITAVNVKADENTPTPMITDGVMDLEQYLFGDVDSNGQTILHRLASNCDNDNFTVRFKPFELLENAEESESAQALKAKMAMYGLISHMVPNQEIAALAIFSDINEFVQKKDNNGETAFDIAKKRNALNPNKRCDLCVKGLQMFEEFDNLKKEKLNQEIAATQAEKVEIVELVIVD